MDYDPQRSAKMSPTRAQSGRLSIAIEEQGKAKHRRRKVPRLKEGNTLDERINETKTDLLVNLACIGAGDAGIPKVAL